MILAFKCLNLVDHVRTNVRSSLRVYSKPGKEYGRGLRASVRMINCCFLPLMVLLLLLFFPLFVIVFIVITMLFSYFTRDAKWRSLRRTRVSWLAPLAREGVGLVLPSICLEVGREVGREAGHEGREGSDIS